MADIINVPVQPGYKREFESRGGMVGKDLNNRGNRVSRAAVAQAGLRTGALKADIKPRWTSSSGTKLTVTVGSKVKHAQVHHDGSRPHVIRARRAKALRYINKQGNVVFALSVNHPGTRANRYLTDNLPLAVN